MDYIKHPEMNVTSSGLPVYEFIIDSAADVAQLPTMTEKERICRMCGGGQYCNAARPVSAVYAC